MTSRSFAILPAAGRSERMGVPKLLLPWRGSTIIAQTIAAWQAGGVSQIVAVVRPDDAELIDAIRATEAEVVVPAAFPAEMKISVQLGLEHVAERCRPAQHDTWLLAPADMPDLAPLIVAQLLASHDPTAPAILLPTLAGRRGHPVLFPWPLAAEVAQLASHEGINALVARHEAAATGVREVPCDSLQSVCRDPFADIDTPEEYRRGRE